MTALATGATGAGECDRGPATGHRLIDVRRFDDARGSIAVIEYGREIGFLVRRAYFLQTPGGAARGAHAHRHLEQLIIAMRGSVDITLDNGRGRCRHRLDQPDQGLYLGPMVWREMTNFSADSLCFVLASECYDDADYIRDHESFVRELRGQR